MVNGEKKRLQEMQNLIPGLPDEIATECLIRVPYKFHNDIKSVCQTWLNLISSPSFYKERIRSGKAEHLVFQVQPLPLPQPSPPSSKHSSSTHLVFDSAKTTTSTNKQEEEKGQGEGEGGEQHQQQNQHLQVHSPLQYGLTIFNASNQTWDRIRPNFVKIPMFCQCVAVPSSGKLLLLGGWDPTTLEPVPDLYVLDLVRNSRWRRAAPMSVARSFFACAVVGASTVYVAGGHDGQKNALKSAEVYDVEADEWRVLPEMEEERDECQGICWESDERFFVVSGYGTESQGRFKADAECYDPITGSWSKIDNVWPFPSISPRGSTATITCSNGGQQQQHQWLWFLGKEQQQQQQQQNGGAVKEVGEIVSSIVPLLDCITEASPCVSAITLHNSHQQQQQNQKVFVMTGNGGRASSSSSSSSSSFICKECEGEGAFIMERDGGNGNIKWNHVHLPDGFSGFPYSASYLLV